MEEFDKKDELRKELNGMKLKDPNVKLYIKGYEKITGISMRSSKITSDQINDCIIFCVNEQLSRERKEKLSRGGII